MKRRFDYSHSERKKIQNIFAEITNNQSDEIKSYLSKYLVIRISGYLEQQIQLNFVYFARNRSAPEIAAFIEQKLNRWTNATAERIVELANSFDLAFGVELDKCFDDEIKDKINSLIAIRNRIAHGDDVGVTPSRSQEFFETVEHVVTNVSAMLGK